VAIALTHLALVVSKSADPRYEVNDGRKTPPFYVTEVEAARKRILDFLTAKETPMTCGLHHLDLFLPSHSECLDDPSLETRDFNSHSKPRDSSTTPPLNLRSSYPTNMSYCFEVEKRTPSLALMPVHAHGHSTTPLLLLLSVTEDALDPCDSGIGEGSALKKYREQVHAQELPHVSYASMVTCHSDQRGEATPMQRSLSAIISSCDGYSNNHRGVRESLAKERIEDLDNDSYRTLMDCTQYAHLSPRFLSLHSTIL
jgi:hypothetical protein